MRNSWKTARGKIPSPVEARHGNDPLRHGGGQEATEGFGEDAIKLLKRIAETSPASRRGTRETREFKKLMMAKLSFTLMGGNLRLLSPFKDIVEPQRKGH